MKRTGEILKKAREQKGLSINEIALSLKISSKILKAIEDGDLSQLPAKTFLRGFVQSYANYLRVDVNEIMRLFQEEMGSTRPTPLINMPARDETLEANDIATTPATSQASSTKSDPSSDKPLNSLAKSNNSRTITLTVLGFVLVGLIIFTKKMIDKYQKEGAVSEVEVTTPIATPVNNNLAPTPQAGNSPFTETTPGPMSTPLATPTPSHTPAPTPTPKATATPKSGNSPTPTPSATATPKPTATPNPTPSPSASPSPSPSPSPNAEKQNKPVEVIIEALDAVEIDFSTKDGKSEKVSLTAEQVHTFKSKTGLKLTISNGGAVNVIVNGKDLGIPGNLGKPVKLSY